jgi:hypothetical protein
MWKLLLHQLLHWIKKDNGGKLDPSDPPVPPELEAEAVRDEIQLLSEQRLRLWRATGAYHEFDFQELAESSLCLTRAVEEQIEFLGRSS